MQRLFVLVGALVLWCPIAVAEPVKFVDVLNEVGLTSPGDWAVYEGERLVAGKPVPQRTIVVVEPRQAASMKLAWYAGEQNKETKFLDRAPGSYPSAIGELAAVVIEIARVRTDRMARMVTLENSTCKLDKKEVPCTLVRFKLDGNDVAVGLSSSVRVLGIISFEITKKGLTVWKMRAIGYGRAARSEWGEARPAVLQPPVQ